MMTPSYSMHSTNFCNQCVFLHFFKPQDDDDDTCEEWERHEALHNDVTRQERNDERLFESEMEVTWDKGSSGLVFYTDAAYWKELEGGECKT